MERTDLLGGSGHEDLCHGHDGDVVRMADICQDSQYRGRRVRVSAYKSGHGGFVSTLTYLQRSRCHQR